MAVFSIRSWSGLEGLVFFGTHPTTFYLDPNYTCVNLKRNTKIQKVTHKMCLCLITDSLDFQPNRKIIVNEHIALTVRLYTTLHKSNGLPPLSGLHLSPALCRPGDRRFMSLKGSIKANATGETNCEIKPSLLRRLPSSLYYLRAVIKKVVFGSCAVLTS